MEHMVKKYYKYKSDLTFLLVGSGLWPEYYKHHKYFRTFLSICSGFANAVTSYSMLAFCIVNLTSINVLARGLGVTVSYASAMLKVIIVAVHKHDVFNLNRGVSAQFEKDLEIPKYRPFLLGYFSAFSRLFYIFTFSVGLNIAMMVFKPLFVLVQSKYVRAYPVHVPFKYQPGGVIHWSIYAFEAYTGYCCWSVTTGVDSLFGFYALHMIGELRLLSHLLENLKSSRDYRKDLKECVERQMMLLKSQKLMQRVFGFLSLWLAVTCAIVMCAIIFQSTEMKHMSMYRAIYLVCYCFLKLVQAYQYAWFGNVIAVESELCLNSVYKSGWTDSLNLRFMNDVLIIQSQKVMQFSALGFMSVRLDMFSKIMQTSLSYFFLLKTLEEGMSSAQ